MKKRLMLNELREMDRRDEASRIRLLEMAVDNVLEDSGYAIQFWRDVELYGVREALTYLKNSRCLRPDKDLTEIEKLIMEFESERTENKFWKEEEDE